MVWAVQPEEAGLFLGDLDAAIIVHKYLEEMFIIIIIIIDIHNMHLDTQVNPNKQY